MSAYGTKRQDGRHPFRVKTSAHGAKYNYMVRTSSRLGHVLLAFALFSAVSTPYQVWCPNRNCSPTRHVAPYRHHALGLEPSRPNCTSLQKNLYSMGDIISIVDE